MDAAIGGVSPVLLERIKSRPLYLWGAAQTGIGLLNALGRLEIRPIGFIDKRKNDQLNSVFNVPVFLPDEVLTRITPEHRPFIINTTTLHADHIAASCRQAGLLPEEDFISYECLCPFDYQVIVSGACNLRCISCPVGNREEHLNNGFMKAAEYEKVLDKILTESPLITMIQLFNWGEPFLNPELACIVEMTNARNVLCSLSSNMNLQRGFEDVIAAHPAFLRISMSGNRQSYAISHTGGKWDLLMKNMEELHKLRNRCHPELVVEVAYHVYATSSSEDLETVNKLCRSLGFVFRPHLAALLPLDNVKDHIEGTPLSDEARATIGMLRVPIDEALSLARAQRDQQCSFERTLSIESDLSVKHCGLWIRPSDNRVTENYLTMPIEKILSTRRSSRLCPLCKEDGLHRFCSVYTDNSSDLEPSD